MRFKILALTLLTVSMASALSGCGNKNGGGAGPEPVPQGPVLPEQVTESDFRGKPGNFGGTWRGECVIQVGSHRSQECTLTLKIRQERGLIDITQDVRATFPGGDPDRSRSREVFTYQANQIRGREGRNGAIGPKVLTIVTPPQASNNGASVRTTLRKTGPGQAVMVTEQLLGNERAMVRAELKAVGRPLPRARSSSRN